MRGLNSIGEFSKRDSEKCKEEENRKLIMSEK